jgi:hypothetical protein
MNTFDIQMKIKSISAIEILLKISLRIIINLQMPTDVDLWTNLT